MSGFWDKKSLKTQEAAYQEAAAAYQEAAAQEPIQLDEEALAVFQEDPNVDIFEEEDEDTLLVMNDASLRLEQGRLYQLILQNNIFADTDADPRAIRNVQREIRKFVRERMETMLGIRQELSKQAPIVSSPFSDLEVVALKMVASKVTKGATQESTVSPPPTPKKDGITSISGNLRLQGTPLKATPSKIERPAPKAQPVKTQKSAIREESYLKKEIADMTPEELEKYNKDAVDRSLSKYAKRPDNLVPHPSPQALEMMYQTQVSQNPAPGSAVARMTDLINGRG